VCVAPLRLGGLRGKKSTPSIGWEVPVKSHRSTSESCMERVGQRLRVDDWGYGTHALILHGRLLLTLHFQFCTFNCVKKVFDLAF
jgi:hypothetical protein